MHRLQSMLDEIEKLDHVGPRKHNVPAPHPPPAMPTGLTSVEAIVAIMEMELDDLDPGEGSSPQLNLIRRHLEQLIKVATAAETKVRDLQDEVKEKSELITVLQETVSNIREKKPKAKSLSHTSAFLVQSSSPRRKALSAARPHECSKCNGHVEAQVLQSCIQTDKVLDVKRQKSKAMVKDDSGGKLSAVPTQPEIGPWRFETEKSPGIWDRETIEKLEGNVKLTKEVEILKRKLEEYKQVLATSEYQRGSAQATISHLTEEVKRYRETLSMLKESKKNVGKKKLKAPLRRRTIKKSGKQHLAQLVIKVCKCDRSPE